MVQGLDELNRRWGAVPERVRAEVAAAMTKTAQEIQADMEKFAPQGETLNILGSIGWTWGDAPGGSLVIGKVSGGRSYGTLRITFYAGGGEAFYARYHEFGTVDMAARPFFYPVWRAWRRRIRVRISRAVTKALKSI